jgi:ParB family chromosome partitioning protein
VVAPAATEGKYEILTGQRRFLAHMKLGRTTILAAILPERVDDTTAKVISVTENLVRRDLNRRDLITACTALYKRYGSIKLVAEETGLRKELVSKYVKYDRLGPELRELVDAGTVELQAALRAQDAASVTGEYQPDEAVKLAKEMTSMSGAQTAKVVKIRRDTPERDVDDIIEAAKAGEKLTQIVVTLGAAANTSLKRFAKDEETTQDDAARLLIEEGLDSKGYFGEGE